MRYLPFTLLPLLLVACTDQDPVAPDSAPLFSASAGMNKEPIIGTDDSVDEPGPGGVLITPSGRCHFFDMPGVTSWEGDIVGLITFRRRVVNLPCDFPDPEGRGAFTFSAPFDGEVTWKGRSGMIAGQSTTNCKRDASQPVGWSCDGTMNARGSGGLEGVQFHIKWGPGWFPFSWTGTAFWR